MPLLPATAACLVEHPPWLSARPQIMARLVAIEADSFLVATVGRVVFLCGLVRKNGEKGRRVYVLLPHL